MFSNLFTHVNLLNSALDASWLQNEVHMQNLANSDTPDYNRKVVSFQDNFRNALAPDSGFELKKTRDKHIGPERPTAEVRAAVTTDYTTTMRMDGNNVDPDTEMVDLAKNIIFYNTLATKTSRELSRIRTAISETK
ncbi:flagellar basal body rod protein FlgB [Oscillospiraceae bacterium OttesenSCG-928-G22]|nr:flagellar basal body rod protein FlgB [Oscillospiraceae bacterium OttesenSCG-928-G22]